MPEENHDLITDAVLRLQVRRDELAMKLLYQTYCRPLLTLSFRITGNLQESEDILQESFLQSFRKITQLKDAGHYVHWLRRIVVNNSLKTKRTQLRFEPLDYLPDHSPNDETPWYQNLPPDQINKAIQGLPTGCRTVFTLYLMEGYRHQQVAELLDINLSTSKSQYRYALKLLREELGQYRETD